MTVAVMRCRICGEPIRAHVGDVCDNTQPPPSKTWPSPEWEAVATDPSCLGDARFDTPGQADYVAVECAKEFGGTWTVQKHNDHWHVREIITTAEWKGDVV